MFQNRQTKNTPQKPVFKKIKPKRRKQVFIDMIAIMSSVFFALSFSAKLFRRSVCSLHFLSSLSGGLIPSTLAGPTPLPQDDSCQQGSQGILCDLTQPFLCPFLTCPSLCGNGQGLFGVSAWVDGLQSTWEGRRSQLQGIQERDRDICGWRRGGNRCLTFRESVWRIAFHIRV